MKMELCWVPSGDAVRVANPRCACNQGSQNMLDRVVVLHVRGPSLLLRGKVVQPWFVMESRTKVVPCIYVRLASE